MDLLALLNLGRPEADGVRDGPEETPEERVRARGLDRLERETSAHAAGKANPTDAH